MRRLGGEARTLRALGRESRYRSLEVHTPDGLRIAAQDWARPGSGRRGERQCIVRLATDPARRSRSIRTGRR